MKIKWLIMTWLASLGLFTGCTPVPLSPCQSRPQVYPECQRHRCTRDHSCGNYWRTTCYPACNETGADFCRKLIKK
ncbi:MAG: hypothetical protein EPO11_06645 [Gammaproteobacteria bacterium]|nr:MAG: hypothetical protein EPO11_06645 [Gammaproteobacteria bacterium]